MKERKEQISCRGRDKTKVPYTRMAIIGTRADGRRYATVKRGNGCFTGSNVTVYLEAELGIFNKNRTKA